MRVAHCLRERGQPAARTNRRPAARARGSYCAWSKQGAARRSACSREPAAGPGRRCTRRVGRELDRACGCAALSGRPAARQRDRHRPHQSRVHHGSNRIDRNRRQPGASCRCVSPQCGGCVPGEYAGCYRRTCPPLLRCPGGGRDRARDDPVDGGGIIRSQLQSTERTGSRLRPAQRPLVSCRLLRAEIFATRRGRRLSAVAGMARSDPRRACGQCGTAAAGSGVAGAR